MHTIHRPTTLILLAFVTACGDAGYHEYDENDDMDYWSDDSGYPGEWNADTADTADAGDTADSADDGTSEVLTANPWVTTSDDPMSTFSVDVDRASYTLGRRALLDGTLPQPATVRVEEWVNAMDWHDTPPDDGTPFSVALDAAPSAFGDGDALHLMRIGIKAKEVPADQRTPANLVFLVDVSGSMDTSDKLPLAVYLLKQLVDRLAPTDTIGIVVYAGRDAVLLEPTEVSDPSAIHDALDQLRAGGSTAGADGLRTAYDLAAGAFVEGGNNRIVLCTDGDFNVGLTGEALVQEMETRADQGIFLTVLGFGTGNLDDAFLEDLSNRADGTYAYIDSPNEALHVAGTELVDALQVVARDVKVQVAFEADTVERWRLIGYVNRVLAHDDFEDDSVDAGDIGAGHEVVAYYEVKLTAQPGSLAEVRLRHQPPEGGASTLQTLGIDRAGITPTFADASPDFRAGAAVAEFAEVLSHSQHVAVPDLVTVQTLLQDAWPANGRTVLQAEMIDLVQRADALMP